MIVIKVILIIFAYSLIGIAVMEMVLWHDMKCAYNDEWLDLVDDTDQTTLTVILWPFVLIKLFMLCIGTAFVYMFKALGVFIKGVRKFFRTVVYLIAAMIDKRKRE